MAEWVDICAKGEIEAEDIITREYEGRLYAIYHGVDGKYYCTDGLCSHEGVNLGDGFVMEFEIECPMHNARFDYRTGEVLAAPACENLGVYEIRENGTRLEIRIGRVGR